MSCIQMGAPKRLCPFRLSILRCFGNEQSTQEGRSAKQLGLKECCGYLLVFSTIFYFGPTLTPIKVPAEQEQPKADLPLSVQVTWLLLPASFDHLMLTNLLLFSKHIVLASVKGKDDVTGWPSVRQSSDMQIWRHATQEPDDFLL